MKIALITAIIGAIDTPKRVPMQTVPVELYLKTNPGIGAINPGETDREMALFYKCQPHENFEADIFIWVDGKVQINSSDFVSQVLAALGDVDLAVLKHGSRKCIYEEVDYIETQMAKGSEYLKTRYANKPIRERVEIYRAMGYPENIGLGDCCVMAFRNTEMAKSVLDYWWHDVLYNDAFDQTAFAFSAWINQVPVNYIELKPGTIKHVPHKLLK